VLFALLSFFFLLLSPAHSIVAINQLEITNIGHLYRDLSIVYAVSPNFFEIAIPGFLNIHEVAHDPGILLLPVLE
jgi:hypothetical protein